MDISITNENVSNNIYIYRFIYNFHIFHIFRFIINIYKLK